MGSPQDEPFTASVLASFGPSAPGRAKEILISLIRHLHAVCREVNLTTEELYIGLNALNRSGQMSDEKRNETLLISDCLGVEALVDDITHKILAEESSTNSCILGPFYRADAPLYENGESIIQKYLGGEITWYHGRILDVDSGKPVAGATLNVWECAANGLYDQQDTSQPDGNMRGIFTSDSQGYYSFYCIKPVPYPVPYDGPAGDILKLMDRSPFRAAHIHFMVEDKAYRRLVTQVFPSDDKYLHCDSVYAVKEDLIIHFEPPSPDALKERGSHSLQADVKWEVTYDFKIKKRQA
ncbi:Catechol 1,2-dioxygenase [Exophiala oligosperma]